MSSDDLEAELRALAESLDVPAPPPDQVAAAVRARLEAAPPLEAGSSDVPLPTEAASSEVPSGRPSDVPSGRSAEGARPVRRRARWKVVAVVVAVILAVTAATPQGRQAVLTILRLAGIEVTLTSDTPAPVATPTGLPGERAVPPGQAAAQARFPVRTLTALGTPRRATVSDGGRVVSMFWPGGVRLDQFDGGMDPYFFKRLGPPFPQDVAVNGVTGWWLQGEHPVGYITRPDHTQIPLRQAGPTLIWQRGAIGYRLEGAASMAQAAELARSLG
jgi:hypothetical protein